jgi:hypothetical protein
MGVVRTAAHVRRGIIVHRISRLVPVASVTNAEPSCSASIANRALWSAM